MSAESRGDGDRARRPWAYVRRPERPIFGEPAPELRFLDELDGPDTPADDAPPDADASVETSD
ncbi:hypothetical protein [Gordonia sp. SL306]|uniref:hypothetical protein n=1 Tax=Gordonia sp. SL306 TaxID=2995145 RepID=UPI0022708398|nr:hypothetical protein [Gordonia sp. SL306]WAC57639.1 hypothetical protein OVA31_10575 [Gordonia sp. SL306]